MKKIFTGCFLLATIITQAQIEIREASSGTLVNNTTVIHSGLATDFEILAEGYNVINNGSSTATIKCKRYETSVVANTQNALCWALCSANYTAGAMPFLIAPGGSISVAPGDTSTVFVLHYKPMGYTGNSTFKVTFYNTLSASDSASFNVEFDVATSVNEAANAITTINVYPNPSSTNVNFDIENIAEKSLLKITDALGQTVKTIQVNPGESSFRISTFDLRSGIYFYSLITNNKAVLTKRLVISH